MTAEAPPLGELEAVRPYPARTGPKGNLLYKLITTTDHKEVTMHTDRSSKLWRNDQEEVMERLQVGDEVDVAYDLKDGMNLVTTVSANRKE